MHYYALLHIFINLLRKYNFNYLCKYNFDYSAAYTVAIASHMQSHISTDTIVHWVDNFWSQPAVVIIVCDLAVTLCVEQAEDWVTTVWRRNIAAWDAIAEGCRDTEWIYSNIDK